MSDRRVCTGSALQSCPRPGVPPHEDAVLARARAPLVYGLGLVSLIALAPIVSVMLLGLLVRPKARKEP